jgi:hypothetical protein
MVKQTIIYLAGSYMAVAVLFLIAATLTSCSELKYAECIARDNTQHPCQ